MKTIRVGNKQWLVQVDDDFIAPAGWSLNVACTGYVRMLRNTGERRESGSLIYEQDYLHRWITGAPKDKVVIFIDRDKLNLQRENLLVCERATHVHHAGRKSGNYKGVHFSKMRMKWIAQITHNGKCYHLASCDSETEAASIYNAAAVRLYGEHAYVNLMPEDT